MSTITQPDVPLEIAPPEAVAEPSPELAEPFLDAAERLGPQVEGDIERISLALKGGLAAAFMRFGVHEAEAVKRASHSIIIGGVLGMMGLGAGLQEVAPSLVKGYFERTSISAEVAATGVGISVATMIRHEARERLALDPSAADAILRGDTETAGAAVYKQLVDAEGRGIDYPVPADPSPTSALEARIFQACQRARTLDALASVGGDAAPSQPSLGTMTSHSKSLADLFRTGSDEICKDHDPAPLGYPDAGAEAPSMRDARPSFGGPK